MTFGFVNNANSNTKPITSLKNANPGVLSIRAVIWN